MINQNFDHRNTPIMRDLIQVSSRRGAVDILFQHYGIIS